VPGEISFAAFGRSDCHTQSNSTCPELQGSNLVNDVQAREIARRIASDERQPGGPQFAVFTGDVNQVGGRDSGPEDQQGLNTPSDIDIQHQAWVQEVEQPLVASGVDVFGVIGLQDLAEVQACQPAACAGTRSVQGQIGGGGGTAQAPTGVPLSGPWRSAMAGLGWGDSTPPSTVGPLRFVAVSDSAQQAPFGGAFTHYAIDVERGTTTVARLIFVDTSTGSLAGSDAGQNPVEDQTTWLQSVLGSAPAGAKLVVVSNDPTYTYNAAAGSGTNATESDGTTFETLLMRYHVDLVVSGRLGWNGLYYATAPGVHWPCPGGSYPDPAQGPPAPGTLNCQQAQGVPSADQLASALEDGLPSPPAQLPVPVDVGGTLLRRSLPFVVASTAGGTFGPSGTATGSGPDGFWHGYTIVHLRPDGSVIVEQRPIFDWVGISGSSHDLQPGQHMQLNGFGREAVGDNEPIQYDQISSPAITHRFDLVQADPRAPYLPKTDVNGEYVPLDPSVATINQQTGRVQTGSGSHARAYAIAILSVGEQAASYPIAFEPARSFVQPRSVLPQLPLESPPVPAPTAHLAAAAPTPPQPPSSAPPAPPEVGTPSLPQLPSLSPPPPVAAVSPPAPTPPPAPPPPPSQPAPLPLALQAKLSPIGINATVIPPSPPPVNPAPPSGSAARKEAKQRQAATAKSEEGGVPESASETSDLGGDSINAPLGPHGSAMTRISGLPPNAATRRDRVKPAPSISALAQHREPAAWSRDLLYGGSLMLAALVLALGFTIVRPAPGRRTPTIGAPAWSPGRRVRLRDRSVPSERHEMRF
jgi:hypothetical protein